MSVVVPWYRKASNLTSLTVKAGVPAANGVVTFGTAVELAIAAGGTATFNAFNFDPTPSNSSYRPADSKVENMSFDFMNFTASVSELAPENGLGNLNALVLDSGGLPKENLIVCFTVKGKEPGGSADKVVQVVGLWNGNSTGRVANANIDTMNIVPCGYKPYMGDTAGMPY